MKNLKLFENWKNLHKRLEKKIKDDKSNETEYDYKTINIQGKDIIYSTIDREIINDKNVGKYAVINFTYDDDHNIKYFVKNNIGKITKSKLAGGKIFYDIKYENIPLEIRHFFTQRDYDSSISYLIKIKEDCFIGKYEQCEIYISANKYNL